MLLAILQAISIHAPPRGATYAEQAKQIAALFQFTPLREGRRCRCIIAVPGGIFQFTPLREGRRTGTSAKRLCGHISIHAPPRGATQMRCASCKRISFQFTPLREGRPHRCMGGCRNGYFNSRPSARGDELPRLWLSKQLHFNSRPSARGDGAMARRTRPKPYFNSRPSARGDKMQITQIQSKNISIHAPPRGATHRAKKIPVHSNISIHAPPRGATGRVSMA